MRLGRVYNTGGSPKRLLPPFGDAGQLQEFSHPPQLNLSPKELLAGLIEHYLFAVLHEILYTSLSIENHKRVTHLEGAIDQIDNQSSVLVRKCNTLRQEEITEEIEIILLNSTDLGKTRPVIKPQK